MIGEGGVMERGGSDGMGWERWRGEGVVEGDGGGKGGVVESDEGEREEWWTVLNEVRGKGWGLMEGKGVLLGCHCLCACSLSCPWVVVMCGWCVVVHGWGHQLGAWGIVCRRWVVGGLIRVGGLFVGAGLLFMGVVVMCRLLCGHH